MKVYELATDQKRSKIIEQLEKVEYYDVEGKTILELERCLIDARALHVKIECSANKFF